jgi:hypothetical protein
MAWTYGMFYIYKTQVHNLPCEKFYSISDQFVCKVPHKYITVMKLVKQRLTYCVFLVVNNKKKL